MNEYQSILMSHYQNLINQGGLKRIRSTKQSIIQMELNSLQGVDWNRDATAKRIALIQKKVSYLFNSKMYKQIAIKNFEGKKSSLLIPPSWNKYFLFNSFETNRLFSLIKWVFFLTLLIGKSVLQGLSNALKVENISLNEFIVNQKANKRKVIVLNPKFPKGNLFNGNESFDFGNWYLKGTSLNVQHSFIYFSSEKISEEIKYGSRDITCSSFKKFDFGISYKQKIQLILFSIQLLISGLFLLLKGKSEILVGYYELIVARRFLLVPRIELPDKVIFSDNHGVLMPIWVNQLMELGVSVDYLFFSSYDSPTTYDSEDPRQDFWKLNSWPNVVCVDQYQADFISENLIYKDQNVEIGGFPFFNDCNFIIPSSDRFIISIFDFEPGKDHLGISTISECGYNTFKVNEEFISHIYKIAQELDAIIYHKPKRRSVLENRSSEYRKFIAALDPRYYLSLPPEVSPARLILDSNCTISMPITTPSLIAKSYGKNSLYFDPLGVIKRDDPALRQIPLANNPIDLQNIINSMKNEWVSGR